MGMLKIFILGFLIFGCTKYSELEINKYGNYFFKTDQIHLQDVELIPWKVGVTNKQIITKGILFTLTFPVLKNKDIFTINEKSGVDSWLVRVRRSSPLGSTSLGYFYSPFFLPGIPGVKGLRAKQIKSMTMQIEYTAATLPIDLVNSPCPPMNHRKVIEEVFVDPKSDSSSLMTIAPEMSSGLEEDVLDFSYQTPTIDGGGDLIGVYNFELAFFDSINKKIMGDWFAIPETLTVVKEIEIALEECVDYQQPTLRPDYNDFKRFKWKEDMFKEERK
jgi:hypothetical protein